MHSKLKGQYRVMVFNKEGILKKDTDFIDNHITASGLLFPTGVAFADCFRYLSIGSSNANPTSDFSGPVAPTTNYQFMGPYRLVGDLGVNALDLPFPAYSYYAPEGCGSITQPTSVELFRSWRIPSGNLNLTSNTVIREITVSPSAPIEIGIQSSGGGQPGAYYLPFNVKNFHTGAFSRLVLSDVSLLSGDFAMISYKLTVSPNTAPVLFNLSLDKTNFLASNAGLVACTGWTGHLSGYARLIQPGIKLISNSNIPTNQGSPNEFNQYYTKVITDQDNQLNYFGMSYTPLFGAPMEPSTLAAPYVSYVSSDNLQFIANPFGGAINPIQTGQYFPYNVSGISSSGVCGYLNGLPISGELASHYFSIRSSDSTLLTPVSSNITVPQETVAITGKQIFKTVNVSAASKGFAFGWTAQQGFDVASVVLGTYSDQYNKIGESTIYPFFDMVFRRNGPGCVPIPFLNPPTLNTGIYTPNSVGPLFLDGINNITLQFQLTWSM